MNCETKKSGCAAVVTQRAINEDISFTLNEDNLLTLIIGNRIHTVQLQEGGGSGGEGSGLNDPYVIPINSNNQTSFLNVIPVNEILVSVFLNGVLQNKSAYGVPNSTRNFIWNDFVNQPLETSDQLTLQTKDA